MNELEDGTRTWLWPDHLGRQRQVQRQGLYGQRVCHPSFQSRHSFTILPDGQPVAQGNLLFYWAGGGWGTELWNSPEMYIPMDLAGSMVSSAYGFGRPKQTFIFSPSPARPLVLRKLLTGRGAAAKEILVVRRFLSSTHSLPWHLLGAKGLRAPGQSYPPSVLSVLGMSYRGTQPSNPALHAG